MAVSPEWESIMAQIHGPNGSESHVRAIVYRDSGLYIAQCIEHDIAAQGEDIEDVMAKLDLTIEAEMAACEERGLVLKDCIAPAPAYFHGLWAKANVKLTSVELPAVNFMLAKAA